MEPAEASVGNDSMRSRRAVAGQRGAAGRFVRRSRTQSRMRSFTVEGDPDPAQMPLVERNHPIETLAASGPK
jgi:hypothetical protein